MPYEYSLLSSPSEPHASYHLRSCRTPSSFFNVLSPPLLNTRTHIHILRNTLDFHFHFILRIDSNFRNTRSAYSPPPLPSRNPSFHFSPKIKTHNSINHTPSKSKTPRTHPFRRLPPPPQRFHSPPPHVFLSFCPRKFATFNLLIRNEAASFGIKIYKRSIQNSFASFFCSYVFYWFG